MITKTLKIPLFNLVVLHILAGIPMIAGIPHRGQAQVSQLEVRVSLNGKQQSYDLPSSPDSILTWIVSLRSSPTSSFAAQTTRVESAIMRIYQEEAGVRKTAYTPNIQALSLIGALSYRATRREALKLSEHPEVSQLEPARTVSIKDTRYETPFKGMSEDNKVQAGADVNQHQLPTRYVPLASGDRALIRADVGVMPSSPFPIIAIIDTGVDYRHPDLGGCLGSACRVLGGYDYIDQDTDPMDENGHGTHVAGIAAGSGRTAGRDPEALMLAYRVLDKTGMGQSNDVIAAIERAIADGADIINLSLGASGGSENDPMSRAVDEAVKRGVLVVVAAGNGGPYLYTIQTPANAALSLTVGALDTSQKPADFSARGPLTGSYRLKPDIMAPGVDIFSAYPGARYLRLSGTSMATPAVAGIAARLWRKRPELTSLQLRSLLIQTAATLPYSRWEVGAGDIQLSRASQRLWGTFPELITLPVFSGQSTLGKRVHHDTLTVFNTASYPLTFKVESELIPHIALRPLQKFNLSPQTSLRVPVVLEIDDAKLPYAQKLPPLFTGNLRVVATAPEHADDTLYLPISLAKASQLQLSFDFPPDVVIVHDREKDWVFRSNTGNDLLIELGKGVYDLIALRVDDGTKWIREGITVEGSTPLHLTRNQAVHKLEFELISPDQKQVGACDFHRELLEYTKTGLQISFQYNAPCALNPTNNPRSMISSFSEAYRYEVTHIAYGQATNYEYWLFPFTLEGGLREDRILSADPTQFRKLRWQYASPVGVEGLSFIQYFNYSERDIYRPPSWQRARFPIPAFRDEWIYPFSQPDYRLRHGRYQRWYALDGSSFDPTTNPEILISPSYALIHPDSLALNVPSLTSSNRLIEPLGTKTLQLGLGPDLFHRGTLSYSKAWLSIPDQYPWFTGWYREVRPSTVHVDVLDPQGQTVFTSQSQNTLTDWNLPEVPEGKNVFISDPGYVLRLTRSDLYLGHRKQQTEVRISLDPATFEQLDACLMRIGIWDDAGQLVRETSPGTALEFAFEAKTCPYQAQWAYADYPDGPWQALSVKTGAQGSLTRTSSRLGRGLPDGYWNLRLELQDPVTDRIVYAQTITPALRIQGNQPIPEPPPPPRLTHPASDAIIAQTSPVFSWETLEKVSGYEFVLSKHPQFDIVPVRLQVNSPHVQAPLSGLGTRWYWKVRAQNQEGWGPWSQPRTLISMVATDLTEPPELPLGYYLDQNYPNPFNPDTQVRFGIAKTESVTLEVYTITGQLVKRLELGTLQAGNHQVRLDLERASNGVYLLRLRSPNFVATRKMTLMK